MEDTFDKLPETSKIWIYQSNRKFTQAEEASIQNAANAFTKSWSAHGNDLAAGARILHQHFIVLSVDEDRNGASGCSIDKSVQFIRELEEAFQISLLDRSQVAFYHNGQVRLSQLSALKMKIDGGTITEDTLIFNNLVNRKADLADKWIIPAKDSWVKRYFHAK